MDSTSQTQIAHDLSPFLRIYEDGRIERLLGTSIVPPSLNDPQTGISSKDIIISPNSSLSARLYLPKELLPNQKLPILIYYHGGGFCIETAFSPTYHVFLNSLVAEANIVVVSVDYRRVPEHPLPTAYDDSWAALEWVATHASGGTGTGTGTELWLKEHGDFNRLVVGGDSAGANIAHQMAMRISDNNININIWGALLIHPYFWGEEAIGKEPRDPIHKGKIDGMWRFVCPSSNGCDDPLINPTAVGAPSLNGLGCRRMLVCVAQKDLLRDRGWLYYEKLGESGWEGEVEMLETEGEEHVFHLFKPACENAGVLLKRLAGFLNCSGV